MNVSSVLHSFRRVGAFGLVAAFSSILPGVAAAQSFLGGPHGPPPGPPPGRPFPVVPEANTGLVLIPIVLAIMFFSARRLARAKSLATR